MSRDLIRAFSQKLARTERLQGGELRDYQAPLLSKLLAHARDNAEFYEQRLGFDVGSRDAIERMWRAIPILTRAEVVTNRERMSSRRTPANAGQVIERETSGSIAMPLRFKTNAAASIANHALTE